MILMRKQRRDPGANMPVFKSVDGVSVELLEQLYRGGSDLVGDEYFGREFQIEPEIWMNKNYVRYALSVEVGRTFMARQFTVLRELNAGGAGAQRIDVEGVLVNHIYLYFPSS